MQYFGKYSQIRRDWIPDWPPSHHVLAGYIIPVHTQLESKLKCQGIRGGIQDQGQNRPNLGHRKEQTGKQQPVYKLAAAAPAVTCRNAEACSLYRQQQKAFQFRNFASESSVTTLQPEPQHYHFLCTMCPRRGKRLRRSRRGQQQWGGGELSSGGLVAGNRSEPGLWWRSR